MFHYFNRSTLFHIYFSIYSLCYFENYFSTSAREIRSYTCALRVSNLNKTRNRFENIFTTVIASMMKRLSKAQFKRSPEQIGDLNKMRPVKVAFTQIVHLFRIISCVLFLPYVNAPHVCQVLRHTRVIPLT